MREEYSTISLTHQTMQLLDKIKEKWAYKSRAEVVRDLIRREIRQA